MTRNSECLLESLSNLVKESAQILLYRRIQYKMTRRQLKVRSKAWPPDRSKAHWGMTWWTPRKVVVLVLYQTVSRLSPLGCLINNISHLHQISLSPNTPISTILLKTHSDLMNEAQKNLMYSFCFFCYFFFTLSRRNNSESDSPAPPPPWQDALGWISLGQQQWGWLRSKPVGN